MSQPGGREARALAVGLVFIEESYIGRASRGPYYFMCYPSVSITSCLMLVILTARVSICLYGP